MNLADLIIDYEEVAINNDTCTINFSHKTEDNHFLQQCISKDGAMFVKKGRGSWNSILAKWQNI